MERTWAQRPWILHIRKKQKKDLYWLERLSMLFSIYFVPASLVYLLEYIYTQYWKLLYLPPLLMWRDAVIEPGTAICTENQSWPHAPTAII